MTHQVTLEPLNRLHARALFDVLQDPQIYAFLAESPPTDFDQYELRCGLCEILLAPNGVEWWLNWVVWVDDEIAGYVQATVYMANEARPVNAEIAYILHSAFHGRGIASIATTRLLEMLIDDYAVRDFWVTALNTNAASIALAQKLGFVEVDAAQYPFDNFAEGDIVLRRSARETT